VYVRPTPLVKEAQQVLGSVGDLEDRRSTYRG
jgi:hypothetical protein